MRAVRQDTDIRLGPPVGRVLVAYVSLACVPVAYMPGWNGRLWLAVPLPVERVQDVDPSPAWTPAAGPVFARSASRAASVGACSPANLAPSGPRESRQYGGEAESDRKA